MFQKSIQTFAKMNSEGPVATVRLGSDETNAARRTEIRLRMVKGKTVCRVGSGLGLLGNRQSVLELDAKVAHGAIDPCMTD